MPQRPMGTGMICGHANEITFNIRQPPTEAMNDTKSAMSNETFQFTSNAPQNNMRSSGRMPYKPLLYNFKNESRNNFGRDFIPIDRRCDVILEEDRKNAEYYNRLDEIDDEVIVTGAVGVPKCYETWGDANFHPTLQNTMTKSGYTKPRKIQAFAIPIIKDGFDIIGQSGSASGKTGAYLLPKIDVMLKSELKSGERVPFALIIGPTSELVLQIHEQAWKFCDGSYYLQREFDSGCDILVSTPGRLNEFLFKGYVHLNKLRYVVLDKADRLMEYNSANDIPIFWNLYHVFTLMSRQNLLFSSTFLPEAQQYFRKWVKENIVTLRNNGINHVDRNIIHTFICVDGVSKNRMCGDIIDAENEMANSFVLPRRKTLVLVEKKRTSDILTYFFIEKGIKALPINDKYYQEYREEALNALRSGNINVLVFTNVLARGMDITDLNHVMIVDLTNDFKTFIYRIGRTERIKKSYVTTLYNSEEDYILANDIEDMLCNPGRFLRALWGSSGLI